MYTSITKKNYNCRGGKILLINKKVILIVSPDKNQ